jgi:hypothetical protein
MADNVGVAWDAAAPDRMQSFALTTKGSVIGSLRI